MRATRKISRKKPPSRSAGDGRAERAPTGDSLNAYIREISKFKPLRAEAEKVLGSSIQQGDQAAQGARPPHPAGRPGGAAAPGGGEPALRRLVFEALPRPGPRLPRPHPRRE